MNGESRPELSVWVVTGDGDSLSIGGNHLIHALRRNVNVKILLFNNQIYGLTKGQYSPTSEQGKRTKSSPSGSIDHPFNPISLALGAEATFAARTIDMDRDHTQGILQRVAGGAGVLEGADQHHRGQRQRQGLVQHHGRISAHREERRGAEIHVTGVAAENVPGGGYDDVLQDHITGKESVVAVEQARGNEYQNCRRHHDCYEDGGPHGLAPQ